MNNSVKDFADSTKNVCLCSTISIVLILIFIISPLNKILIASIIGKIGIIILLIATVFMIINNTYNFTKNNGITMTNGSWDQLKSNIICNYIFAIFLLILLLFVIKKLFVA
jgi:uncharacterized membrane protein